MYLPETGVKIRQLRTQREISQAALAALLGVSKSVISSYETGVHLPPYDILIRIARIFGVSTDYLLGAPGGRTVNVDGLTDTQVEAIIMIIRELRQANLS